ncbi:MAG TPA: gliding motility-associated C-terminal domain-containing protein [Sediminibacterium sp.]
MKNRRVYLVSFVSILLSLQNLSVSGQSTVCTPFIYQKDTTICSGASVLLDLKDPPPRDSLLPGVWKLLIPGTAIDSNLFNIKAFGFDKANQYLYSIIHKRVTRYDLKNNTVSAIPANNWPGDYTEFTYDYTNKRLLCWRGGRDSVYALPENGGSWVAIGAGTIDRETFGSSSFWNPVTKQVGIYGGYGFNEMKSWIFENDGFGWVQKKSNPIIDSTPPKGGNLLAANADGTKLYLFSGQGSYSGNELSGACALGSAWASAGGMFCWLRDLWELDLSTYKFQNILPVNSASILYEGALSYYADQSRFYLFGGFQPTDNYATNQNLANTNKTFYFRRGIDTGFKEIQGEGQVPPALAKTALANYAYYDATAKRMIWARHDGIWAYYPDSTTAPPGSRSVLWSTGDTTAAITVKPLQTTMYRVTRTIGNQVCKDSILITVTNMQTSLQTAVNVCGNSTSLDAGAGFASYQWNTGETTRTITVTQTGTYRVAVTKAVCTATDSSKVSFAVPVADFTVAVLKDSVCAGDRDSLYITNPQAGITYSWRVTGNTNVINTGNSYATSINTNTSYTINGASNPAICSTKTAVATIVVRTQFSKPVIRIDSVGTSTLQFSWDPVPGATAYQISTDKGISYTAPSSGAQGRVHILTGLLPNTNMSIAVKATGPYVCQTSDTAQISATTRNPFGNGIYVPNAITPNGDGVNDVLLVYGTAISSVRLIIYSQWGTQLFLSTDLKKGWDGTHNGQKMPAGLYTYSLEAVMQDGSRINKGGTFSVIR